MLGIPTGRNESNETTQINAPYIKSIRELMQHCIASSGTNAHYITKVFSNPSRKTQHAFVENAKHQQKN